MRLRDMKHLAFALVVCALAAGCVSLTPGQRRGADEVRAMADDMARVYGVRRIAVLVGDDMDGVGGTYRRGLFTITTSMLTSRHRDSIVAHELAHYLLDHDRPLAGTLSLDWQREQERRELDANAKAVEILMRVRGLPEEQALRIVYDHLLAFNRMVVERRTVIPWGHRAPCEEIADLLGRFPRQRAWSAGLACAPKQTERRQVGSSGGGTDGASRANSFPG
jgi:O6-methylguanine-DNA--protein-cysteine methyltransferase